MTDWKLQSNPQFAGRKGPLVLAVLDGVGVGDGGVDDAVKMAATPTLDAMWAPGVRCTLRAHGTAVGLPSDGDMGNSEVGHNAMGCGRVYDQGAKLVETAADINAELAPLAGHLRQTVMESTANKPTLPDDDDDYSELRKVLSHDPTTIDDLENRSGLTIEQLSSMLLILELHGEVESLSGGRYALIA